MSSHHRDRRDEEFDIASVEGGDDISHDTSGMSGFRQFQVRVWLTFEDSSYSMFAKVVQGSIIVLIIMSTGLMLVQSVAPCYYDDSSYEYLVAYPRLCDKRPSFGEEPIAYFILETVAIVAFTIEYGLRLLAAPATVG